MVTSCVAMPNGEVIAHVKATKLLSKRGITGSRLGGELDPQGGGWHGVPFWVPVIRFPDGNYAFSVNES